MALAAAVAPLIKRDDAMCADQAAGCGVPLAGMAGKPMQQHDGRTRSAVIAVGQPRSVTLKLTPDSHRIRKYTRTGMQRNPRACAPSRYATADRRPRHPSSAKTPG
jgi:hypothetical protein